MTERTTYDIVGDVKWKAKGKGSNKRNYPKLKKVYGIPSTHMDAHMMPSTMSVRIVILVFVGFVACLGHDVFLYFLYFGRYYVPHGTFFDYSHWGRLQIVNKTCALCCAVCHQFAVGGEWESFQAKHCSI